MLMMPAMFLALLGAGLTGFGAGLDHTADNLVITAGPTRRDSCRSATDVGAIEVEADTLAQFGHLGFAQAGIGAGHASLRTVEAEVDTSHHHVISTAMHLRMGSDHCLGMHRKAPFVGVED